MTRTTEEKANDVVWSDEREHGRGPDADAAAQAWSGDWVARRLGVELRDGDGTGEEPGGAPALRELLGLALRRNPKRAHLLVSNVLGKHVPASPGAVHGAGYGLGRRVRALLGEAEAGRAVVLGYAETATALGHSVADGLGSAPYLHSTRRPVPGVATAGGFEESHSHATSHLLLPADPALLAGSGPLVLVDDEFSTGNTVLNTIRDLHARHPRDWYVVVALVDMRSPSDRTRLTTFATTLGARVDLISLATGTVTLPDDVLERGTALVAEEEARANGAAGASGPLPAGDAQSAASGPGSAPVGADPASRGRGPVPAGDARPATSGPGIAPVGANPASPGGTPGRSLGEFEARGFGGSAPKGLGPAPAGGVASAENPAPPALDRKSVV